MEAQVYKRIGSGLELFIEMVLACQTVLLMHTKMALRHIT